MASVIIKNITKKFNDIVVVNNLNLEIKDREFIVIVGPSGCGKTTTLRMIAGLEEITVGEIYINNQLINDLAPKERNIAMVFQNYALYPHMKVADNIGYGLKMRKVPRKEALQRVHQAAGILGITDLLDRKPRQLSGGQKQRVALGRAIVRNPDVFLFDEPLSNLDAKLRVQMRTELKKLHERLQATTIYVTHDQVEAMTLGHRILIMKDGLVQQIGEPLELYNKPANHFVAGFIGSPSMNFTSCVLRDEGSDWLIDTEDFKIRLPKSRTSDLISFKQRELVLGIRPEDLYEKSACEDPLSAVNAIRAKVVVIEPLGKEIFIDAATGKNNLTALMVPNLKVKLGRQIELVPDLRKMHLFQKESGECVL
ncbi:MAG: sn-glycerol-3-phosphate ABC transporter ATP-binding protein UgpC [Desulfobacterales bacterium]|jgi:multiple sugar transport system ATP-binding protein